MRACVLCVDFDTVCKSYTCYTFQGLDLGPRLKARALVTDSNGYTRDRSVCEETEGQASAAARPARGLSK